MENKLARSLQGRYPVMQTPMPGVASPEMPAAAGDKGELGSLSFGGIGADTLALIRKPKALTESPIVVGLFADASRGPCLQQYEVMQSRLEKICSKNHWCFEECGLNSYSSFSHAVQIEGVLNENIAVVSLTFSVPENKIIEAFKTRKVIFAGTAACLQEVFKAERAAGYGIIARGIKTAGHRAKFLHDAPLSMIGPMLSKTQLARHSYKTIVAAGGIGDGRTLKPASTLGVKRLPMGMACTAVDARQAILSYTNALQHAHDTDIILTKLIPELWARRIKNKLMAGVENPGAQIAPYPISNLACFVRKRHNKIIIKNLRAFGRVRQHFMPK